MPPATLCVVGQAEREVLPDRFAVSVDIRSRLHPTPQQALAATAEARARMLRDLAVALPDADVRDAAITTETDIKRIETKTPVESTRSGQEAGSVTETHYEHLGYFGRCTVTVSAPALSAAAVLAACAMHPDTERARHEFELSRERTREIGNELECEAVADALARAADLAAAADHAVTGLVSIGELPQSGGGPFSLQFGDALSTRADEPWSADDLEAALGELRPEPEELSACVPVRVEISPIGQPDRQAGTDWVGSPDDLRNRA